MKKTTPELPRTKRELRKMLHAAWTEGVMDAQERLTNEAERVEQKQFRHSDSLQEAVELLDGLIRRGRGGR